jgi:hypothetical protein
MVNYFNSLRGKLMRKFLGLPIYIGHPDDPEYDGAGDRSIYGRVENLKVEDDVLWVLSRWTELGKKLFDGGFLRYLSPRWLMRKVRDRIFQPVRLISIGMTNHPNLCRGKVSSSAGGAQCLQLPKNEGIANKVRPKNETKSEILTNPVQDAILDGGLCAKRLENQKDANEVSAENNPVSAGECATGGSEENGVSGGGLHVSSLTENLFERTNGQPCKDRILALVYEQMANFGDDYQSAWNTVKRRFPALFGENFNLK